MRSFFVSVVNNHTVVAVAVIVVFVFLPDVYEIWSYVAVSVGRSPHDTITVKSRKVCMWACPCPCPTHYGPCPAARDRGCRVCGLVYSDPDTAEKNKW